jgi:hypothetical protein
VSVTEQTNLGIGGIAGLDDVEPDEFAGYVDYFGFDEYGTYTLPDGKQSITFKKLNEGERQKYEQRTQRDVAFNRRTDDAKIRLDASADRTALIELSVTGWNLVRRVNDKWTKVSFSNGSPGSELSKWILSTDPRIVNELYTAIRKANPFLNEEMTVEMIDEEIARLQEMRADLVKRDAEGKDS